MNVFFLDINPITAARMLCDKHIVSQLGETRMILRTALYRLGHPVDGPPYNPNGRFAKWAAASGVNFSWLADHGLALLSEYAYRYRPTTDHVAAAELNELSSRRMKVPGLGLTPFAHAIKRDGEQIADVVAAYREYYVREKARFAKWERGRAAPSWWPAASEVSA